MPEQVELQTISSVVDERAYIKAQRTSVSSRKSILRTSQGSGQHKPHVPPTIPEDEYSDGEVGRSRTRSSSMLSDTRSNHTRKNSGRSSVTGHENRSYDGPLPDRNSNLSNSSSMQSLQVQKEQYCCCSKLSPCERKLLVSVAVMAAIIVALVIVTGLISRETKSETFFWKF